MKENGKNIFKKICAVTLTAAMLMGGGLTEVGTYIGTAVQVSAVTSSSEETPASSFKYEENEDGSITITKFIGDETNVVIPSKINGKAVTSIGSQAFEDCTSLKEVTIGNGVTYIPFETFACCTSLINITIPDSVTSIGAAALADTAWYDNQPDGVVYAGKVAYEYKGKGEMPENTKITLKDDTVGIAYGAFAGCKNLAEITIPNSVTSIDWNAFDGCTSLTEVTIPNSVTSIGDGAFCDCTGLTEVTIPDSVTSIGGYAFAGCTSLTEVTIPNSVTSIGMLVFADCTNLAEITIPNSVTSIGEEAFGYCTSLKDVYYTGTRKEWKKIKIGDNNYCLTDATIHYNSEMPKSEEEKKAYLKAHTDFLNNSLYEKITNDWLSYSVSSQIMNFDEYKEIKDNYNVWRLAVGDYFENPYTLVVAQMIYSAETDSIMEELTSISFAKNEREMIDKISEVIDYNGYDFEKKEFKSNLKDYIAGKNVDSATANILQKLLNENSDEVRNILKKYDKIGKGINKFETGQKILSSVSDVIKYNATVYSYYDSSDEYKSLLKLLQSESYSEYSKTNNNEYLLLYTALDKFISTETEQDVFESVVNEAIKSTDKVLWSVTKKILQKKVTSYVMQNLTKKLGAAEAGQVSSFLMGCVIGRATGILVMDGLFNLSDSANEYISAYYKAQMAELFKGVLKNSADTLKVKQTYENARTFHQALQMYKGMELDTINGLIKWYETSQEETFFDKVKNIFKNKFNQMGNDPKVKLLFSISNGKQLDLKTKLQLCKLNWNKIKCPDTYDYEKNDFVYSPLSDSNLMSSVLSFHCPVDVKITDKNNNTVLEIKDEKVIAESNYANAIVCDGVKNIVIFNDEDYNITVKATDNGVMNYSVMKLDNEYDIEAVASYDKINLTKNDDYNGKLNNVVNEPVKDYQLTTKGKAVESESTGAFADEFVPVTSITLSETELKLNKGNTKTLTASINPENATVSAVTWMSSEPNVASVDEYGNITAVSKGQAEIICTSEFGTISSVCKVTVNSDNLLGNTNGDGKVNIADALMIARYDAKLTTLNDTQLSVSDVNGDSKVNIADALKIARYDAKLIDKL